MSTGTDASHAPLRIDVWSDVACPWCYIGKRRLESALAQWPGTAVVEYHSFELSPDTPDDFDGSVLDFLAERKGMEPAQVSQMFTQVSTLASAEGLAYDFDAVRQTRTLRAHELLHHAKAHGVQDRVKELLLSAFFEQGKLVSDVETLADLAAEAGLDRAEAAEALRSGTYRDAVADDIALARQIGVTGVPFYVFDGRLAVSGAQSPEVFRSVLERAHAERA